MKKIKVSTIISVVFIILCIVYIIFAGDIITYRNIRNVDYDEANEITKSFDGYGMNISTIVTIDDGENTKQNAIDQTIGVVDKKRSNMLYRIETTSTVTDVSAGTTSSEENSYMYYANEYYYDYPGVKYRSGVEHEKAVANIENLLNIISFDYDDMVSVTKEYDADNQYVTFNFTVSYDAVSDYVKSLLASAVNTFEDVTFSPVEVSASAKVNKAGFVEEREMYVEYASQNGERIVLEIYTSLTSTPKLTPPVKSEYMFLIID